MEFHELLERIGVDAPATVARLGGMESILRRFILKFPQDPTFSALAHAYDCLLYTSMAVDEWLLFRAARGHASHWHGH